MAWRPHSKFSVNPDAPSALGVCDRCYRTYQLNTLKWQLEWRGISLEKTGFLVCDDCLDVPFIFNRPKRLPADPVPVPNPRPLYVQYTAPAATWDSNPSGIAMSGSSGRGWDDNLSEWL